MTPEEQKEYRELAAQFCAIDRRMHELNPDYEPDENSADILSIALQLNEEQNN